MNKFFLLSVCSFAFFLSCSGNTVRKIADGNVDSLCLSYLEQGAFFYETALENGFEKIAAVQKGYPISTDEAKDSALYYAEKALELDPENVSSLMFKLKVLYKRFD